MSATRPETGGGSIPELGPLMGRLAEPPRTAAGAPLDDVRLALATRVFELAGAARAFCEVDDVVSAVQSLSRQGWLTAWEAAVDGAARHLADRLDFRLRSAASESRLPGRRLRQELLSEAERRGIGVRIGSGGWALVDALDAMEARAPLAPRSPQGFAAWCAALAEVARKLDSAWRGLEAAAAAELDAWGEDVGRVRSWRRSRWPLWAVTAVVLGVALWVGLVLGGFVPAPDLVPSRRRMVVGPVSVLGVGIDLVEIPRVRRMLERRGERALARFLTDHEREYVLSRPDPVPHIAARLAAKEAVYKALQELPGCRGVGWREIEVSRDGSGRPSATLSGLAERAVALAGGARIHLSLSHSHRAASAVAVLERIAGSGEPG